MDMRRMVGLGLVGLLGVGCGEDAINEGQAPGRVYATVTGSHEVVVVDAVSHEILSHIQVGEGPAILLKTPDDSELYSANWRDATVSAIDVASEQVTSIDMGSRPYVIAMAPDGSEVYVGCQANEIAVIDTATHAIVRRYPQSTLPASIIVSPDGGTLYVATLLPGRLYAVDARTGDMVHPAIAVGSSPAWISISRDGELVYTLNFLSDDVSVVDTASWTVIETVSTGAGSQGIIGNTTPDDTHLYVTNHGTAELVAIARDSWSIDRAIPLNGRPVGVNFNGDGSRVYVTDFGPDSLDRAVDLTYLTTGTLTTTGNGQLSAYDTATGEPIGDVVETGPGATSVVVID